MRLLVITCVSDRSEVGLYKGLAGLGDDVYNLCDPLDRAADDMSTHGVQIETLPIKHRFDSHASHRIRELLLSRSFDCIYAPTSRGLAAALRATKGLPIPIISYRGTMGHLHPLNPVDRLAHLHPRVTKIVANCDAVRKFLLSVHVPELKLSTVFKGHSIEWYQQASPLPLSNFQIPSQSFTIACVAKIRPLKGVRYILHALDLLREKGVKAHLLLIGDLDDPEVKPLTQQLSLTEQVHFLGYHEHASAIVASCSVSVMASTKREGVARAVVESMALGVPAIVTSVGGLPEIIVDGVTGFVVAPESSKEICDALYKLWESPETTKALGNAAQEDFKTRFQLDHYVNQMRAVFEEACEAMKGKNTEAIQPQAM